MRKSVHNEIRGALPRSMAEFGSNQVDKVLPTVDDTPLGEDDHFDILTEMMPVAGSWKTVGRGLRIDSGRLNTIQESNSGKPKECLSEMLTCWLNRNYNVERFGEPTWRAVVKVVAHPAAGDNCALALNIAKQHSVVSATASQITKKTSFRTQEDSCASKPMSDDVFTSEDANVSPEPSSRNQSEETQNPLKTGSPTPTSTTSSFPYLKVSGLSPEQQEGLRIRLCVESEDIIRKFGHLHSRVYESLCKRNVPVDKLVTHLLSLGAFDPVYKGSQKPMLQTIFQELQNAGSIEKVLFIIRDYFSFFNYHVIEHIVNELGTDQDRAELQNYQKVFGEYSKRRVYECPPDYGSKSSADHVDLVVKVDSVYEEFTVKELKKFQYRLSRIFCVAPQSVLRLCRVEEGCLQLIFQIPSFVQQEIFPLPSEQERALTAEGVIRLTCGNYQFAAKADGNTLEPKDSGEVQERVDAVGDSEEDKLSSVGGSEEGESSSLGDSEEEKTDPRVREEELLKTLQESIRESIAENNVDSFHRHLDELERIVQNNERMKVLLEEDGVLCYAAWIGSNPVVETLIEKGLDINTMSTVPEHPDYDDWEMSPLHWAADGGQVHTVKYLIEKGAEVNSQDDFGRTPLLRAAGRGHFDAVTYLVQKGANIHSKDINVLTPLHWAALGGHVDTVTYLVQNGANIHSKDNVGYTPLDRAAQMGHEAVVAYLKRVADPNMLEESESTGRQQEQRQSPEETGNNRLLIAGGIFVFVLLFLGIGAWCGLLDSGVPHLPGNVRPPFKHDAPPTLDVLRYFPVKGGHIDIAAEIPPDYEKFGTLLLEDKTGNEVESIRISKHNDPLLIKVEILRQWLQGKGNKPGTWQTLVTCLRATGLTVLADRIDDSLSKQDESKETKNLDRYLSEL